MNRIKRRLLQHRWAGEHLQLFEMTIHTDDAVEQNRTLYALKSGRGWIGGD